MCLMCVIPPNQIPELVYQPSILGLDSAGLTALIERILAKFQPTEAASLVEVMPTVAVSRKNICIFFKKKKKKKKKEKRKKCSANYVALLIF
jgi:hypothetical protein